MLRLQASVHQSPTLRKYSVKNNPRRVTYGQKPVTGISSNFVVTGISSNFVHQLITKFH